MTVFELCNVLAEAQVRAMRQREPRRWWYRWWATEWQQWIGEEYVSEPDDLRPTEVQAIRRIRSRALLADRIRNEIRVARMRADG